MLVEEIELIQGLNHSTGRDIGIYVEIKSPAWHRQQGKDISPIVLQTMNDFGYRGREDNAFVQCFDPVESRRIRQQLDCQMRLVQLIGDNAWQEADTDFDAMQTEAQSDTGLVELAHAAGLLVHAYTLRKDALPQYAESFQQALSQLEESKIDGLFTDFTDLAVEHFANQGRRFA